jgi:ethanolamine kinase
MPIATVIAHHGSSTPREGAPASEKNPKISDLKSPNIWDVMDRWVSNVPESSVEKRKRKEQLKEELRWLIDQVGDIPGVDGRERMVFGHCDLLSANVIIADKGREPRAREQDMDSSVVLNIPTNVARGHSPRSSSAGSPSRASAEASAAASNISIADDEPAHQNDADDQENINADDDTALQSSKDQEIVDFIDYEYATPCPAAFDIANHFAEWGGFDCDFSVLPTKSQRRDFLSTYLNTCDTFERPSEDGMKVRDLEERLDELMTHVDSFRGAPGFYWGVWALIQAEISQIKFDYANYAEVRLGEYFAWKNAVLHDGKSMYEVPLREARWAEQ